MQKNNAACGRGRVGLGGVGHALGCKKTTGPSGAEWGGVGLGREGPGPSGARWGWVGLGNRAKWAEWGRVGRGGEGHWDAIVYLGPVGPVGPSKEGGGAGRGHWDLEWGRVGLGGVGEAKWGAVSGAEWGWVGLGRGQLYLPT